jgi:zinc transporter
MHEQLTDLRAELVETRTLVLAIVALVFLPLTFITGLLGMNVEGIPFAKEPWAFWGVVGVCAALAVAITGYFAKAKWFN